MYSKCLEGCQPEILVEVPITFQKNRKAYMQLFFYILWVRNKAWCKSGCWLWKCSESSLTNPAEDHDANDILCAFFSCLVLLTLIHSDRALRKLRITSALFVCWKGSIERPCSWWEAEKGIFYSNLQKRLQQNLPLLLSL